MVYFIADECKSYQVLDQADRSMSFADSNVVKCDKNEAEGFRFPGWYRFMGDSGDQMPDKCVPTGRCGTRAPGWLNGQHPTEQESVVTREVCYHWKKECCKWKNDIKIRNCGEFYVYELQKPPTCDLRYCGNQQGESLFLLTITFTVIQDGKRTRSTYIPAFSRRSVTWGAARKMASEEGREEPSARSERTNSCLPALHFSPMFSCAIFSAAPN